MRFLSRFRSKTPCFSASLQPDAPFYAVGDVHGRIDKLHVLLDLLKAQAHPTASLILVGDYVDRGDQTAQVLQVLHQMQTNSAPGTMTCLRGNHEAMLLAFLDRPERNGARWLRYGGLQTLASYNLRLPPGPAESTDWVDIRDRLRAAIGPEIEAWLRALPLDWQSGNVYVCHAGADPDLPVTLQSEQTLLWGHPEFDTRPRTDGIWVVHGHTIVDAPCSNEGRISIDTGAYATGKLTAALIEEGSVQFLTT